jgi:hypothetical protein
MNKILVRFTLCVAIVCAVSAAAFAQGRGRGNSNGRRDDVFADRDYSYNRGRNQNWKCGKFVNCHDARDGRRDGRSPRRVTGFWRDGMFIPRGSNVGYRRYNMNDYWRRRHITNGTRYNRVWRDRY